MKDSLTILATTQNHNRGDSRAALRIIEIYQILKQEKLLSSQEVSALLIEALELKKIPKKEIESLLAPPLTLFCFPYAGGSSSLYENWSVQLPKAIRVVPMEYPGRGIKGKIAPIKDFQNLLSHLEAEILSEISGPFAFFGHSLGAIVAFELAHLLQSKHDFQPITLFLSGSPAPDKITSFSFVDEMGDEDFIQILESLNGTPKKLTEMAEFKEVFLPVLRADFSVLNNYRPIRKRIKCPLKILAGKQDTKVNIEELSKWSFWTESNMSVSQFEGDHFFIRQPNQVLNTIAESLCPQLF
jgi:medium-chain acyl-[acyl-carrier-protein] hydrolase